MSYGQGLDLLKESTLMRHCPSFNKSVLYEIIKNNLKGSGTGLKVGLNKLLLDFLGRTQARNSGSSSNV